MKIKTKFFGEIDIDENQIILFPFGIYGFEEYNRFIILHDEEAENGVFRWLQCADEEGLCFTVMEPGFVCGDYLPKLPENTLKKLGVDECCYEELIFLVIIVLYEEIEKSTVNLLSPIVINPKNKVAAQVILETAESQNSGYKIKHRIFDLEAEQNEEPGQGGDGAAC
jgi:flagellar assembly factor FliW